MTSAAEGRPAPLPRWALHLVVGAIMLVIAGSCIIAADVYMHHRLSKYAAVNVWGYRGRVLGRKAAGEKRIVMIGPSTVFSVGFPPEQALPAQLEDQLQRRVPHPVHVVNLGMPGEDAYAYRANLEDYRYLKPDGVIFYGDSNPTGNAAPIVQRRLSPIFRWTGYYPILQTALIERYELWRNNGKFDNPDKVVFRGGAGDQHAAQRAGEIAALVNNTVTASLDQADYTCEKAFKGFCTAMDHAISYARSLALPVLVVNQPYETEFQVNIQNALQAMLREKYGNDAGVTYLDMGHGIDLKNPSLAYDGVHLTPAGNAMMAAKLVEPSLALLTGSRK